MRTHRIREHICLFCRRITKLKPKDDQTRSITSNFTTQAPNHIPSRANFSINKTRLYSTFQETNRSKNPASSHNSLQSFLKYTRTRNQPTTSTTYQGTLYEYLAQTYLTRLSFTLTRTGGRNDTGIDLTGHWALYSNLPRSQTTQAQPSTDDRSDEEARLIPIIIQCKRTTRVTPTLMRELEGSFNNAPASYRDRDDTLGMLVCTRPATRGIREAMGRSQRGLAWLMLEDPRSLGVRTDKNGREEGGGGGGGGEAGIDGDESVLSLKLRQFLWNRAAAERCGLEGLSVALRYNLESGMDGELDLFWQGARINFGKATDGN